MVSIRAILIRSWFATNSLLVLAGRFKSADWIGGSSRAPQSLNRYAYVHGGPLTYRDPFGLQTEPDNDDLPYLGVPGETINVFGDNHLQGPSSWFIPTMPMVIDKLSLVVPVVVGALAGLTVYLIALLKREHRALWEQLGSPNFVLNYRLGSQMALFRFVWSKEATRHSDRRVRRASHGLRVLQAVFLCILGLAVLKIITQAPLKADEFGMLRTGAIEG